MQSLEVSLCSPYRLTLIHLPDSITPHWLPHPTLEGDSNSETQKGMRLKLG